MLGSKNYRFLFLALLSFSCFWTYAAKVDSLDVFSAAMNKTYKAVVVLPN